MGSLTKIPYKSFKQQIQLDLGYIHFDPVGSHEDGFDFNSGRFVVDLDSKLSASNDFLWDYYDNKTPERYLFDLKTIEKFGKLLSYYELTGRYFGKTDPIKKILDKTSFKIVDEEIDSTRKDYSSFVLYSDRINKVDTTGLTLNKLLDKDFGKKVSQKAKEVSDNVEKEQEDKELSKLNLTPLGTITGTNQVNQTTRDSLDQLSRMFSDLQVIPPTFANNTITTEDLARLGPAPTINSRVRFNRDSQRWQWVDNNF